MALVQANQPFHYSTPDGVEHSVAKGDLFDAKDPIVQGREALLDAVDPRAPQRTRVVVDVPDLPADPAGDTAQEG